MDKTAIKNFAVRARNKLIKDIEQKAYELGITEKEIKDIETFEGGFRVKDFENSKVYKKYEIGQREKLIANIRTKGFHQLIEEVAYTWFNRFIALRFMEVNEYLPTGVKVLSSVEEGKIEPDIIKEALNVDFGLKEKAYDEYREIVYRLLDAKDTDDLYRFLLVKQCNQLGSIMPMVFEEIGDYTELLLPDRLLGEGSVIRDLVDSIKEEDYKDQVEIIGWMYQYYISEKKDQVFAGLRKNKKITKENIPAATQLFTPKWIVKYMVENSLGRLWLESHPDKDLQSKWEYYLEEADQDPQVQKKLDELKDPNLNPEDIKLLDPAMGSGHILVYAFDLLYDIYLKANYSERDVPRLILEKNLYGLDIDDRAGQLAAFALMMKARSKNRRIFRRKIDLNISPIQESNGITKEAIEFFYKEDKKIKEDIEYIIEVFKDAKEYGSILDVKKLDFQALENRIEEIRSGEVTDFYELEYKETILDRLPDLIKQGRIMSAKYDVVSTNPPYMGRRGMNPKLIKYLDKNYPYSKSDLFAVFMELNLVKQNGYLAMINQHSWMFLSSFEKLREKIINSQTIYSMLHLGPRAFEEIGGEVVQSTAFVFKNKVLDNYKGSYVRLVDFNNSEEKEIKALDAIRNPVFEYCCTMKQNNFKEIPGIPLAYWVSENFIINFYKGISIDEISDFTGSQNITANNNKYLRLTWEIERNNVSGGKWVLYSKGGEFRKHYGNLEYVVDWSSNARKFYRENKTSNLLDEKYWYKKGVSYSGISTKGTGFRYLPEGCVFDKGGPAIIKIDRLYYILALLNSKVTVAYLSLLNPTLNIQVKDIKNIPIIIDKVYCSDIENIQKNNVSISKSDWDSFETSWDFKVHPLANFNKYINNYHDSLLELGILTDREAIYVANLEHAYNQYKQFTDSQFNQLKSNEEELNRIFIEIYGLEDELTPEVSDRDITITKIFDSKEEIYEDIEGNRYILTKEDVIKSFVSYAVGCMFGRYSLDEEGLIFAGGQFKDSFKIENGDLKVNTSQGWKKSSLPVTMDNVLIMADDDYFQDDIVNRFVDFVKVTFGQETLEENLDYIAEALGQRTTETSRQTIRRYFLRDFYKDHVRSYQKRPIYWQFNSGRQDGFKALIYMHRYDMSTVARIRTDYLHKLQRMYEAEVSRLDHIIDSELPARDRTAARKKRDKINKQIEECLTYDQIIGHIAHQRIEIDLDDGVKNNYALFQGVKLSQGEGRKPLKADLLSKI